MELREFLRKIGGTHQSERMISREIQGQIVEIAGGFAEAKTPWFTDMVMSDSLEEVAGRVDPHILKASLEGLVASGDLMMSQGGRNVFVVPLAKKPEGNEENYYRTWPELIKPGE